MIWEINNENKDKSFISPKTKVKLVSQPGSSNKDKMNLNELSKGIKEVGKSSRIS